MPEKTMISRKEQATRLSDAEGFQQIVRTSCKFCRTRRIYLIKDVMELLGDVPLYRLASAMKCDHFGRSESMAAECDKVNASDFGRLRIRRLEGSQDSSRAGLAGGYSLMCNLYRLNPRDWTVRFAQDAKSFDNLVNIMDSYEVYPDREGLVIRNTVGGGRQLVHMRWGLPSSKKALLDAASRRADKIRAKGKEVDFAALLTMEPDGGTTNVRNTKSAHWKPWLGVDNRCLVPFTRFAEPDPAAKVEGGRTPNAWFALNGSEPIAYFAGIWIPQWTSVRKIKEGQITADFYGFLTTEPNGIVAPVHQRAMPVILTNPDEVQTWLTAPWEDAKTLQRPLPDAQLIELTV